MRSTLARSIGESDPRSRRPSTESCATTLAAASVRPRPAVTASSLASTSWSCSSSAAATASVTAVAHDPAPAPPAPAFSTHAQPVHMQGSLLPHRLSPRPSHGFSHDFSTLHLLLSMFQ